MIDLTQEQLIRIREVPKRLPKRPSGKRIHVSAVYRWTQRGIGGVQLEAVRIGGTTYTSLEALQRFAERTAQRSIHHDAAPTPSRKKALQRADANLDRLLGANSAATSTRKETT